MHYAVAAVLLVTDGRINTDNAINTHTNVDLINIFEVFLPQLLRYPNPTDPLNGEAAALLMREPAAYDTKVKGKWCRSWWRTCFLTMYRTITLRARPEVRHERGLRRSCRWRGVRRR